MTTRTIDNVIRAAVLAVAVLTIGVTAVVSPGCAGRQVRENVLQPSIQPSIDPIREWATVAIASLEGDAQDEARVLLNQWTTAGRSGDRGLIRSQAVPLWPSVRAFAIAGIRVLEEAEEVGPGVADSFRENVAVFAEAQAVLAERVD